MVVRKKTAVAATADPAKPSTPKLLSRFFISYLFRLVNAFLVTTFFQPDEYYQAWEPAYSDVVGVGFRTWEWRAAIRTSLVPRIFGLVVRAAQALRIDHLTLSKFVMAAVAAIADVYTGRIAGEVFGARLNPGQTRRVERVAWLVALGSTFNWYVSTRPFSNTFEMTLVAVAFYHWLQPDLGSLAFAQVLAHIAIALRPSNAVLWLILGLNLLWDARDGAQRFATILLSILVAGFTQAVILKWDLEYFRGSYTLPFVEFLRFNLHSRISEIYGSLPWYWYFVQGVPFLLLGYLPWLFMGWQRAPRFLRFTIALNLVLFSLIPHKEFRFIYYLLPLLHPIVAVGAMRSPRALTALVLIVNIAAGAYFGSFHQRGVMSVVEYIRRDDNVTDVSFLMPCHSTPWQAHFQRPHDAAFAPLFLTCEPPWNISSVGYVDEADQFYLDPAGFLAAHPEKLASAVVVFEPLRGLMESHGYKVNQTFFNGLFNDDSRRQGSVLLMRRETVQTKVATTNTAASVVPIDAQI